MKKLTAILLTLLLLLGLTACHRDSTDGIEVTPSPEVEETPTAETRETALPTETETETNTPVEYEGAYAHIALILPGGWTYETVEDLADGQGQAGIRFWPEDDPGLSLQLCGWTDPIGLCATGVTIEDFTLDSGLSGTAYSEVMLAANSGGENALTEDQFWITMVFHESTGVYALEGNVPLALWEDYETTVYEILETVKLGEE